MSSRRAHLRRRRKCSRVVDVVLKSTAHHGHEPGALPIAAAAATCTMPAAIINGHHLPLVAQGQGGGSEPKEASESVKESLAPGENSLDLTGDEVP